METAASCFEFCIIENVNKESYVNRCPSLNPVLFIVEYLFSDYAFLEEMYTQSIVWLFTGVSGSYFES
jgi:hypothetical protein